MFFRQIRDDKLSQYAYLVACQQTKQAVIIDPERDIDRYVEAAAAEGLEITAVVETHIHADFLAGTREFAERYDTTIYVSDEGDENWKYEWVKSGDYDAVFLRDGDTFRIGNVELRAVHTPGHTPEHLSFTVTDHGGGADEPMGIVTGDFVFVGDLGRPDLLESAAKMEGQMKPMARRLYGSVQAFLELSDYLQVWPGHGAGSACGKSLGAVPESTVGYERRFSPAFRAAAKGEDAFVDFILDGQSEPPLYFARMKELNRDGVPLLPELPEPEKLTPDGLERLAGDVVVLDTRVDQAAFARRHIPGALHAPLDKHFNSFVGSLVDDENARIYLIADDAEVEQAVRALVRMGYDNVVAYADLATQAAYFEKGGDAAAIELIDFDEVDRLRKKPGVAVFDTRFESEYEEGHIPDALHVSYTRLPEHLDEIPADKTLLVHCASGIRSTAAASFLARHGRNVRIVLDEWRTSKWSLVGD